MFAVIHIADFCLQAVLRQEPDLQSHPVALAAVSDSSPAILQCTATARRCGVSAGLTASQAVARCPRLKIRTRSLTRENSAAEILLQTAYAFSPNIESTLPGVCTMDLKGLGLGNQAEIQVWCEKILTTLGSFQLKARIGLGPTPDLALLAAQGETDTGYGASAKKESSQAEFSLVDSLPVVRLSRCPAVTWASDDFVVSLPVATLAPPADILDILGRWGIRTVGEFLALGKAEVAERLGAVTLALFDRVSPAAVRPLKLVVPPESFSEQIEFEGEIETVEPILFWLRQFTGQLAQRLQSIYLVVAQLELRLGLASGGTYERSFKIPSPTGEAPVLFRTLQTHLENVRTESPVISLQLVATPAEPDTHQFGLFENTLRNPNQFAETLARLSALLGSENVGTPVAEPTCRPDAFRVEPPNFEFVPAADLKPANPGQAMPFRRFRPPLPARFEFREDLPAHIASPVFTGAVVDVRGPFRSSGNWWDDTRWAREEWDAELAGGALVRLFRSSDGCFVEGVYD